MSAPGLPVMLENPPDGFMCLLRHPPTPALPESVLADIMLHLELRDVLACRLVSKTWSRAAAAGVCHLDVPCKALAAATLPAAPGSAGRAARAESPDEALRRLHRMWPAIEAVTLSGLASAQALQQDLCLQFLTNHLSRWRNLREINLRDMPVLPTTTAMTMLMRMTNMPAAAPTVTGPLAAPPRPLPNGTGWRRDGPPGEVGAALLSGTCGSHIRVGGSGGMGSPRSWGLASLSSCLGLNRLSIDLVRALDPPATTPCSSGTGKGHEAQGWQRWQREGVARHAWRPEPHHYAAGQAALLEGLTGLTRLTHLSISLLDLPPQSMSRPGRGAEAPEDGPAGGGPAGAGPGWEDGDESDGSTEGTPSDTTSVWCWETPLGTEAGWAAATRAESEAAEAEAAAAAMAEEEYVLDADDAGDYGTDLDIDMDSDEMDVEDMENLDLESETELPDIYPFCSAGTTTPAAATRTRTATTTATIAEPAETGKGIVTGAAAKSPPGTHRASSPARRQDAAPGCNAAALNPGSMRSSTHGVTNIGVDGGGGGGGSTSASNTNGSRAFHESVPASRVGTSSGGGGAAAGPPQNPLPVAAVAAAAAGEGGAGAAAEGRRRGRHWMPHPALFAGMGPRLRSLQLTGCDLRGGGALVALAAALTALTSLSLHGRLSVSHDDLAALSGLRDLRELSLSRVELLYDPDRPDDCPAALIMELYVALRQLPYFHTLQLNLNDRTTTGIYGAYLMPLHESPLAQLRSLTLAMLLDSDYSFIMLAGLTTLTALSLSYVTFPLVLQLDDMTLLAPLTGLRRFSMHREPSERYHYIALCGRVVQVLSTAWPHLSQLAFTGQILPDEPGEPSLACLANWTALRDLSLNAVPDDYDDWDGDEGAAGAQDLRVDWVRCLPAGLTRLALSGVRVRGGELLQLLAGTLTRLTSLQVVDCGLTPEHLMVGDCGATQLQVLVLNDSHPWRACQSERCPRGAVRGAAADEPAVCQRSKADRDGEGEAASTAPGTAGMGRDAAANVGGRGTCRCCCSPSVWATWHCRQRPQPPPPPRIGVSERAGAYSPSLCGACGLWGGAAVGDCRTTDGDWRSRSCITDVDQKGGSQEEPVCLDMCGVNVRGRCYCWRHRLVRHSLATLGSLHSLEFLMLGLPDDVVSAEEVLRPLGRLRGLRSLTLRARGLRAGSAAEVAGLLGGLTQLRRLHLMGPPADAATMVGAERAARGLPYLK